jgi:polyisoprenoid-binding protein YceI
MKCIITLSCCLAVATISTSQDTHWTFDPVHSTIGFNATHLVISKVTGKLLDFSGDVTSINDENFSNAEVSLTLFTPSINTNNQERDKHLKSSDFF